jgi:hypothetical protein
MSLRLTPEIRFIYDEAHDRGERVRHLRTLPAPPPHAPDVHMQQALHNVTLPPCSRPLPNSGAG